MSISAFMESFQGPLEGGKSSEEVVTHKQLALEEVIREPEIVIIQPTPLADHMLLGALRHSKLRLKAPLHVNLSTENEYIIVECPELNEFGYGPHLTAAIADLQHTIAELYFALKEDQDRLGGDLPSLWATLQAKIQER